MFILRLLDLVLNDGYWYRVEVTFYLGVLELRFWYESCFVRFCVVFSFVVSVFIVFVVSTFVWFCSV